MYINIHTNFFMHEMEHLPMYFYTASNNWSQEHVNVTHEFYQILLILDGHGTVKCMGKTYELKKGSGFFKQANIPAEYYGDKNFTSAWLTAYGSAFPGLIEYMKCDKFVVFDSVDTDHFISIINKIVGEYYSLRRGEIMAALTFTFYAEFLGQNKRAENHEIERVAQYIENNYAKKLTLEKLASISHTSVSTLCHNFKEKYNLTVFEYILHIRLHQARLLITQSPKNTPIKSIAASCGFNDVSYFCRAYKKKYGTTPSQERNINMLDK